MEIMRTHCFQLKIWLNGFEYSNPTEMVNTIDEILKDIRKTGKYEIPKQKTKKQTYPV